MKKLILIGAGGHGKSVYLVAKSTNRWTEIFFLDDNLVASNIIGNFKKRFDFKDDDFFVSIGNNLVRKSIIEKLQLEGFRLVNIISSTSDVTNARIGIGSIVMNHVFINVDSIIGDGVIINNVVFIEHDCNIGNYSHLSPKVTVAGTTKIGQNSWLGVSSTVINNITIGNEIIVGAGSVVVKDLKKSGTYVGIPAKQVK